MRLVIDNVFDGTELEWLNQKGGRNLNDVLLDSTGRKYVTMYHPDIEYYKVYLPEFRPR